MSYDISQIQQLQSDISTLATNLSNLRTTKIDAVNAVEVDLGDIGIANGVLTLGAASPTDPNQAVTKAYVDAISGNTSQFAAVAVTGDYGDLLNKPTIPSNNNQLTNGAGYATVVYVDAQIANVDFSDYSNTAQMEISIDSSNTAMKSYVDAQIANVDFSDYSTTIQMNTAIATSNTLMKTYVDGEISTVIANTYNYTDTAIANLVDSAPVTLDTLNELAAALGDDANFSTTTANALGLRLRVDTAAQGLSAAQKSNALTNLGISGSTTFSGTFDDLSSKTSGTGEYSTSGILTAGRGGGGVSLTINDGYGNANITWNHKSGVPEQNGNAARIEVNTDSVSGARMDFELKSNVTSGSAVTLTNGMTLTEGNLSINGTLTATGYNNANWDTAYGWGDHSVAGYITTAFINDEGSAAALDLDNLTASSDEGYYSWSSTQPTNSPGWVHGGVFVIRDNNQNLQLAIGNSGNGTQRLAIRRADSGSFTGNSWTEFWSTRNFSSTDVSNWNTAYGWGDHSVAGYISSFNITSQTDPKYLRSDIDDQMLAQLSGGFGAVSTGGTTDWNHSTNARSGGGYTLLTGNATNGPGGSVYYHPFSFEYVTKNGTGNMTQLAFPYNGTSIYHRYRYSSSWSGWVQEWNSANDGSGSGLDADLWDGNQFSSYLNQAVLTTSQPTFSQVSYTGALYAYESSNYIGSDPRWNNSGYNANEGVHHMYATTASGVQWGQTGLALYNGGAYVYLTTKSGDSNFYHNNNKMWSASNDGSGSGLDADLLDGQHGSYYTDLSNSTGQFTMISATNSSSRDKIRVYPSSNYAIGMQDNITYGHLNDWAMTFQMNDDAQSDRGFWWGDSGHGLGNGAMSLTVNGRATIATSLSIGQGESITAPDNQALYVSGDCEISAGSLTLPGSYNLQWGSGYNSADATIWSDAAASVIRMAPTGNSSGKTLELQATKAFSYQSFHVGSEIGSRSASLSVESTGSSSPIAAKTSGYNTVWGILPWSGGQTYISSGIYYDDGAWVHASDNTNNCLFSISGSGAKWYASNNSTGSWNLASNVSLWNSSGNWDRALSTNATYNGSTIWHAGNDGSGSALDADLLDGLQGSDFMKLATSSTSTATQIFSIASGQPMLWRDTNATTGTNCNIYSYWYAQGTTLGYIGYGSGSDSHLYLSNASVGSIYLASTSVNGFLANGYVMWHAGNDGSGSGLDADTVDGIEASGLLQVAASQNITGHKEFQNDIELRFGNSANVRMEYRATGDFYCRSYTHGGRLLFQGENSSGTNKALVYMDPDDATSLYHAGVLVAYTYSSGWRVTGNVLATGDVYAYYSDERLKDKTGKIEKALDKVDAIETFYYTHNDKANELGYEGKKQQVGVSAQSVESVMPEIVHLAAIDDDGKGNSISGENYKTVQYEKLVPLLIESIKELRAEIKELKENIK